MLLLDSTAVPARHTVRDSLGQFLTSQADHAFVLLRIVAGLLFAFHGLQKFGVLSSFVAPLGSQLWFGAIIELVTGTAIAAGVFTRAAAVLASGTMAVAYIQFHWKFALGEQLLPAVNQGEPALLYSVLFLYIACRRTPRNPNP